MREFIKDYKTNGPLESKVFRFFCSHAFNSSYNQNLNSVNFVKGSFTVFFNDFAEILSYLIKLKEIEKTGIISKIINNERNDIKGGFRSSRTT